jgi:LPS-assembly protein
MRDRFVSLAMTNWLAMTTKKVFRQSGGFIAILALVCATAAAGVAQAQSDSALPPVKEAPEQIAPPPKPVTITADKLWSDGKSGDSSAQGNARIVYGDKVVTGDSAVYNQDTGDGVVEGHVRFTDPKTSISADTAKFNSDTTLGTLYRFYADFQSQYFIRGSRIERLGEDHYKSENCFLTTCGLNDPDWEFSAGKADVTIEGYAFLNDAVFRAGGWPILYLPYMIVPAKTKRATGFLIPSPGYSSAQGFLIQNQFFWAIADNQDATFSHHYLGQAGNQVGLEYRYILSPTTFGALNTDYLMETDPDKTSNRNLWRVLYDHRQTLPGDVSAVAHINKESDGGFSRQYSSNINDRTQVYTDSYVTFGKNWGTRSLLLMAREQMNLDAANEQVTRKLPEIKFTNQKERIGGSPFYAALESSYTSYRTDTNSVVYDVDRADFSPMISLPIPMAPYLSAETFAGYRSTLYSIPGSSKAVGESFSRNLYNLGATLIGPKIYQIFDTGSAETPLIKHLITPTLLWNYTPGMEVDGANRAKVRVIDAVDSADPANTMIFQLSNDLLAKTILSPESSQTLSLARLVFTEIYNINEANRADKPEVPKRPFSSTEINLMTTPAKWLLLNYKTTYNFYENLWDSSSIGFGARYADFLNVALDRSYQWGGRTAPDTAWDTGYIGVKLPWWRLTADYSVIYNEMDGTAANSMTRLKYRKDCWGIGVTYEQRRITSADPNGSSRQLDESRTMFTLTLVGVGEALGAEQPSIARPKLSAEPPPVTAPKPSAEPHQLTAPKL